jgi:hypothetical protein
MPVLFGAGITASLNGSPFASGNASGSALGSRLELTASNPPSDFHIPIWSVNGEAHRGNSTNPLVINSLQRCINNATAQWLRVGAVSSGGSGNVTSQDVTYLARYILGHNGFSITDRRIANLRGLNREPKMSDVTLLARWLVGQKFEDLKNSTAP